MGIPSVGISGLALYLPPYRVDLRSWCEWTGADWNKIQHVVGTGFRLLGPGQSVYTMAANAVMQLIRNYDIDASRVRYLALGTESSTDNSAGAIIIKGMVDSALKAEGRPLLSRNCEVPELKHACLGGVYGLKNALRFLATDGQDAQAIVVCADKALYQQGSSGEPTQGAGAVATLLEANPKLMSIDLSESGTASDYRGLDFRKPLINRNGTSASPEFVDIPVFNGKYSIGCYIDEMQRALENMYQRRDITPVDYLRSLRAVFMHRPYQRMPESGWSMAYLFSLARGSTGEHAELARLCDAAKVDLEELLHELREPRRLTEFAVRERISEEIFPAAMKVLREFRRCKTYQTLVREKITLGVQHMRELGNLYTAALPAWVAAGFTDALERGDELAGEEILMVGYGSGDAADAIPARIVEGWQQAVRAIGFGRALVPFVDLNCEQYREIRENGRTAQVKYEPRSEFIVERVGTESAASFQDAGIEYYRYIQ